VIADIGREGRREIGNAEISREDISAGVVPSRLRGRP
jgi:hypothetical protein